LLFIIIVEGSRGAIREAKTTKVISRVKVGRDLSLTHLLFVDDVFLFLKGVVSEARKLNEIMDLYSNVASMDVNIMKSAIYFSSLTEEIEIKVSDICPLSVMVSLMVLNT
jgi:hypothetical protein